MFSRIRSARTTRPVDEQRHLHQHVVEQDCRVRQEDPLGGTVADVAFVPQDLVLHRGLGVAAEEPGQPGDPLCEDRIALMGHRRAALLAGPERLHDLADLGVLEFADLGREPLERAAGDGDGRDERGVAVTLDDLRADRVRVQAEVGQDLRLDIGAEVAVRPDRPRDLAGPDVIDGARQADTVAIELERPAGELRDRRSSARRGPSGSGPS